MSTENNSSASEVVSMLKMLAETCSFSVYIPSLKKEISFKQLSTEQLKLIYKTAIDPKLFSTEFTLTFNNIIKENCLDNTTDLNKLTIFDKFYIFLKTRIESLTSDYIVSITEEERQQNKLDISSLTISLNDYYNRLKNKNTTFNKKQINHESCKVVCEIPTIETENLLEQELLKNAITETTTEEDLVNIVSNVFINEIVKFITTITVNDTTINLNEQTISDRAKVVEQLPSVIIKEVLKYIEDFKNQLQELLLVPIQVNDTTTILREIPYNASFFNV
jgi:hypothetical protein